MILLCGIPSEPPLAMVREQLERLDLPYLLWNQRRFADMQVAFRMSAGQLTGWLQIDGRSLPLEEITGIYLRLMDDQRLPELEREPPGSRVRRGCRALHDTLLQWCEIAPGRIVNRLAPMGSNSSKPYQAQLIWQYGFRVPETLITNDPNLVHEFLQLHGRLVFKSISGARSIVRELSEEDLPRLGRIRACPTQFQEYVPGHNVRVHTVGQRVFATIARTQATDYRYAARQVGDSAELEAIDLPDRLAERCVDLARGLELDFAGIDLKVTPEGWVYCLEVNPCPAYSYYELHTDQPIARTVACYLAGRD